MAQKDEAKARYVGQMFSRIAPRYDLMNRLMTLGRDRAWRRELVRIAEIRQQSWVLDVGSGTADLAIEVAPRLDSVVALDFSAEMMSRGQAKASKLGVGRRIDFVLGDALALPFADDSFDCALAGFALRNMTNLPRCLAEMRRVLKPGGRIALLELVMPSSRLVHAFHHLYLRRMIPLLGRIVARDSEAYVYLPKSIAEFPQAQEVQAIMGQSGFQQVSYRLLSLGMVAIHTGLK